MVYRVRESPKFLGTGNLAGELIMVTDLMQNSDDNIILEDSRLVMTTHDAGHSAEDLLRAFVRRLTDQYGRSDLAPAIEIILKELITNAAKANFKKLFFAENGLLMEDPEQYQTGILRFRNIFSEDMFALYSEKAREARLCVTTIFNFNEDRFEIEIRNNVPMSSEEERRVREKMRMAMECGHAGRFIMENVDETEGAGLGLMLCIAALRSIAVDPRYLSIATDLRSHTVARLEIPLRPDYRPARERWTAAHAKPGTHA